MGLTERHWFENEDPELTERQLEDAVYEEEKAYNSGYVKGFHDAKTLEEYLVEFGVKIGFLSQEKAEQLLKDYPQIIRCKDCRFGVECIDELRNPCIKCEKHPIYHPLEWFCADGVKK